MKYLLKDLCNFEEICAVLGDRVSIGEYLDKHPDINIINDVAIEIGGVYFAFKHSISNEKYEDVSIPEDERKYAMPVSIDYRLSLCESADEFDELFSEMLEDVYIFDDISELDNLEREELLSGQDAETFYMRLLRVLSSLHRGF